MTDKLVRRFLILLASDEPEETVTSELSLARLAPAYYAFKDSGADIALATSFGGPLSVGITERDEVKEDQATLRFKADRSARDDLAETLGIDQIVVDDFDAAFCLGLTGGLWSAGGLGAMLLVRSFLAARKPVALIPGRQLDIAPLGAGDGLLIIADTDESSACAARILINAVAGIDRQAMA